VRHPPITTERRVKENPPYACCVVTANPAVGAALLRVGIGRLPEEIAPSPLDDLALPALKTLRKTAAS